MTQQQKHVAFKTAFDTFNGYLQQQNLIGAYVVAFSILEDRMAVAFMLLRDLQKQERPSASKFIPLGDKIKELTKNGHIEQTDGHLYLACARDRNSKLHAAMWNLNEFSSDDCHRVIKLARKADKVGRELKKLLPKNKNAI